MFYTVVGMYIATCIVLGVVIFLVMKMEVNAGQQCMLGYVICAMVQNVGYLFELTARTAEGVMIAIRMQYLASTYILLFLCGFVFYFLREKRPKYLFPVMAVVNTSLLCIMWLDSRLHWFYNAYTWVETPQHCYFEMDYGAAFYLWICCCLVCPCLIVIRLLFRSYVLRKTQFEKRQAAILTCITMVPLLAFLVYVFGARTEYDFNPITMGLTLALLTIILFRSSTDDIKQLSLGKMVDRTAEAIIVVDDCGSVIDCNAKAIEVLGDIRGRHLGDARLDMIKRLNPEELNKTFDIHGRMYETRVEGIYAKDGRVIGYQIMLYDTTQLHEAMEELKVLKEKAEDANRAKSDFLSSMSHEIRTPMNTIVGITEIMLTRVHERENQEYLMNIKTSGEALLSIINDILDFSKIESGSIQIQHAEYDIMSIIQDLGMMFLNRIGEKPIELLFDIDRNLPAKLLGDSTRLRQVIINIVNNAIKYTNGGYVKLEVVCKTLENGRYDLQFAVTDTGIGIKQEDLPKLFDTFTRVDVERNYTKEGTGLGLTIAKRLIQQMEGSIEVESIYGMGTRFTFHVIQDAAASRELAVHLEQQENRNVSACFQNNSMLSTLIKLTEAYHMNFINKPTPADPIDYFFTDLYSYKAMGEAIARMKQAGTKVIVLQNPMVRNPKFEQETVLNKPLYTLSFANAISGVIEDERLNLQPVNAFIAPGARVLIVDDNSMNLKVAKGLIEPLQVEIATAMNGKEAVEKAKRMHPDLILMDHMMPVMDGVQATRKLRSMEGDYYQNVPIVALTANAIVGMEHKFIEEGMNGMIAKPIDIKKLYRMIRSSLPEELVIDMGGSPKKQDVQAASQEKAVSEKVLPEKETVSEIALSEKAAASDKTLPEIEGIDVKKGIAYCQGEDALYEMFDDFCADVFPKSEYIRQLIEEADFERYTIEVHGLKGTARLIGATELGDLFYELEKLGKAQNLEGMKVMTPEVLERYHAIYEVLAPYRKPGGGK